MSKVMAIGAHPDDIEFGCSGTLIKHSLQADVVAYVCLTGGKTDTMDGVTGESVRTVEQWQDEIRAACTLLNVDGAFFLGAKDLHLKFDFKMVSELEYIIKDYKPDIIYTHWDGDANQDHKAAFNLTMAAARYVKNVYCYEQIPIPRLTGNPMDIHKYVDITGLLRDKIHVALAHRSQIDKYSKAGFDVVKNLTTLAKFRGIQAGCKHAEAFQVIKEVW